MTTKKRLLLFVSSMILLLCLSVMPAYADNTPGLSDLPEGPDPQSWVLNRDQTWSDLKPNPVIDWMTELNPASLSNKFAWDGNPNRPIIGGLILVEYLDRKFISRGEVGSDPLGYYLVDQETGELQDKITQNPVISATDMIANEKYDGDKSKVTDADFAQWWADFFNKPQELNNYLTIDEYWREVSYGKWAVELKPFGPITIPYFEFEMTGSYKTYREAPPSFRSGSSGTSLATSFDNVAIPLARTSGAPFSTYDFFFMLHAGYDQSGVWQEFGQAQFPTRASIPYELGPGPRMLEVEAFFTESPEWLTTYEARYRNTPSGSFWKGELDKYNALKADGKEGEYVFHLTEADWEWVDGYFTKETQKNTRYVSYTCWIAANSEWSHMNQASNSLTGAGRTMNYSTQGECDGMATFAHEFGHIASLPDNYGTPWTLAYSPLTEPWEIMSRGSFAGPGGDHARWTVPGIEAGSVPVHEMIRDKIVSKYYDAKTTNYSGTVVANDAKADDLLEIRVQDLAASTPVVAEIVARNIPLNNRGEYPELEAKYNLVSPNYYKGFHLTFGNAASGYNDKNTRKTTGWTWTYVNNPTWMSVEVVDQSGYDTYTNDHGVIISRISNEVPGTGNGSTWSVVDSHLYDIAMIDYELDGDYTPYPMGHAAQLADAAFHAGTTFTDTGYYANKYDPEGANYSNDRPIYYDSSFNRIWTKDMLETGSIFKGEEQGNREVVSGNTVNEFYDQANKMHYYILAKNENPGRVINGEQQYFLSYTIGLLHENGPAVGGELTVAAGEIQAAAPGKIAVVNFDITNTGDATDIVRVGFANGSDLDVALLNNLYAIEAGKTVTVPLYVTLPEDVTAEDLADLKLTLTASSESNAEKVGTASVDFAGLLAAFKVVFLNTDGVTVLKTVGVTDGGLVSKAQIPYVDPGHGNQVKGWLIQESGDPFDFTAPITKDYYLMPWIGEAHLRLTTEATNVKAGDKFTLHTYFSEVTASNTAILDFVFDTDKFAYESFTPADNVSLVSIVPTDTGARVTVMILDYEASDLGVLNMAAKSDADLYREENEITVTASYVVRLADGSKKVEVETASTQFGTTYDDDWDGITFNLIYLSNMIDVFGLTSADPKWKTCQVYDLVPNGQIDINDVAFFANKIVL